MSNTRNFRPARKAQVKGQRAEIQRLRNEVEYARGLAAGAQAQLAATRMERPADLEEWINEVAIPSMNKEEREAWLAMSPEELEAFKDSLGEQINATKLVSEL